MTRKNFSCLYTTEKMSAPQPQPKRLYIVLGAHKFENVLYLTHLSKCHNEMFSAFSSKIIVRMID